MANSASNLNPKLIIHKIILFFLKNKQSVFIFLTIGFLTFILYLALFTLLWEIFNLHYRFSISIAYITSVFFYFFSHRYFTFQSKNAPILNQFIKFIVMTMISYLITFVTMHVIVEILKLTPYIGLFLATAITIGFSYLLMFLWVFKKKVIFEKI